MFANVTATVLGIIKLLISRNIIRNKGMYSFSNVLVTYAERYRGWGWGGQYSIGRML
jgi:hypothetical protein